MPKAILSTRSQAVARIADRTASQQTLVITDALPMKLHAVNSTSFRLLYRSTIRITPRWFLPHRRIVAEEYNTESFSKIR